jgi:hypothetical protein
VGAWQIRKRTGTTKREIGAAATGRIFVVVVVVAAAAAAAVVVWHGVIDVSASW